MNKGKFIAFEGIDGSGKSTQLKLFTEKLKNENMNFYITKEPTDNAMGLLLRRYLSGELKTDDRAIAALFAADRLDHILNDDYGLIHKINSGVNIVTDRYYLSSYAYQSVTMPMEWVLSINSQSSSMLRPDINVFIDITPEEAINRIHNNRSQTEIYETLDRLKLVRSKFFEAFEATKENVLIIDGSLKPEQISEKIWKSMEEIESRR